MRRLLTTLRHACVRVYAHLPPAASWQNTYEFGVAVQFWGATPPCGNPPACQDAQKTPKCCTADCQVLGTGAPQWSLLDPTNPGTGGVKAKFLGAAASDSDPFWCTFNPSTGAQVCTATRTVCARRALQAAVLWKRVGAGV